MAAFSLLPGRCLNDNKTMKEIDNQLSTPEQSGGMPSHPVTFVSNDEPSPMPWPNTWYPVTPIGPETEYPCPCSEGDSGTGSTDNNSVDFSIEFGRFPKWPELSGGRLMLNLNMMDAGLCWGTAFQYEHISQRRLEVAETLNASISRPEEPEDVSRAVVKTEKGFPRYYSFASPNVSGAEVLGGTQMFKDRMRRVTVDGVSYLEEVQESGMTMRFRPNSAIFDHIVTPRGVKITFAELAAELKVVRQDAYDEPGTAVETFNSLSLFMLKQVWNKTDGLLDLSNVQSIRWYAPADVTGRHNDGTYIIRKGAVPIKTWKLSWSFADTETMVARAVDEENPEVTQMLLQTFRIEEPGGFISEWRAGLYPDDLTLVKGEGDDAISIVTRCLPAPGHENLVAKDINGQAMVAGGYYTDKKEKFKYVYSGVAGTEHAVLCSAEKEVYQRRLYGDVLISRTEGYGTPLERTWTYGYGSDPSSPNYGKRIRETRPDGAVVEMEYDSNGNVIQRTEPWYGDISMRTSYSYADELFNDRRISQELVELVSPQRIECLEKTQYEYNKTEQVYSKTATRTYLGSTNVGVLNSVTTVEEWYTAHDCVYAPGRLKCRYQYENVQDVDNPDIVNNGEARNISRREYSTCSDYGAVWKCTEDDYIDVADSEKSSRIIRYYAENGDEIATDHQVHLYSPGFVSIDFRRMSYDPSHRLIRTDYANGLYSMMEWSCAGPLWETDVRGLQTRYTYDGAKRLVCVERDAAVAVENWNDVDMNADCPDSITETTYDGMGRILSVSHSIGDRKTTVSSQYDLLGRVTSRTDKMGRTSLYSYSQDGLTMTETTSPGATLVTRKAPSGLVVEESGTGREARYYEYKADWSGIWKYIRRLSSSGDMIENILENADGKILRILHSNGAVMVDQYNAEYNGFGQIVCEQQKNECPLWYHYNNRGELTGWMRSWNDWPDNSPYRYSVVSRYTRLSFPPPGLSASAVNAVWRMDYVQAICEGLDADFEYTYTLVSRTDSALQSLESVVMRERLPEYRSIWEKVYNENGNIRVLRGRKGCDREEEEVILNGDTVRLIQIDGTMTQYKRTYSMTGDMLTIRDARGKDMTIVNDATGRETSRTDQDGETTTTSYDAVTGLANCIVTPDGKQTWFSYDFRGRLVQQYGTAVQPIKWEYDAMDRIVALHTYRASGSVLDAIPSSDSDITRWTYDPVSGLVVNKTYADGSMTSYYHDDWGRLGTRIQSRGVTTEYQYDTVSGKIASITYSDGTPSVSFSYDRMDRLSSVQDASGTRSFYYWDLEDIAYEQTSGMVASLLEYQRDSLDRSSGYTFSLNGTMVQQVALEYDVADRLSAMSLNGSSFTYGYDSATGWLNSLTYPNGLVRNTVFHANLPLPVSLTYVKGTSSIPALKHAYTWDSMRRPSVREDYVGSTALSRRHTYGYNARGELTEDTMNAGGAFSYDYDNIGNRQTAAEQGISSTYRSNSLNQYATVTRLGTAFAPVYDSDGNQTSVNTSTGIWSVQYNADNRPVVFTQGSKKVECVYDYLGRRVEKVEYDGNNLTRRTRFAYMGYLMVASMDCTQNTSNPPLLGTWFWDPSESESTRVLAMCTHNADKSVATTRYVAHDLLKSVSALFDSSGNRQAKFEYTPYGETLSSEGIKTASMPFLYSCEYHDEDLGLIYYNYRHYNPQDGRWISRDPIGEKGGVHLYGFVKNNPVSISEYLGLSFSSREERYGDGCVLTQDPSDITVTEEFAGTRETERYVRKVSEAVIEKHTKRPKLVKTAVKGLDALGMSFTTAAPFLLSLQVNVKVEFTCRCKCKCEGWLKNALYGEAIAPMTGSFTINSRTFGNGNPYTDGLGSINKIPKKEEIEEKKQEEFNKLFSSKLKECEEKCKKLR